MYDAALLLEKLEQMIGELKNGNTSRLSEISAQHIKPGHPLVKLSRIPKPRSKR